MRQSYSLGRVLGIEIRLHVTWLLAFAFITWGLANGYYRFLLPRQGLATPLLLGAVSALLLFASVLVHEFSHSLVAKALGMRVHDITLFIFGGVSNIGGEMATARDEFLVAVVGPLTSFALAVAFLGAGQLLGTPTTLDLLSGSVRGLQQMTPAGAVLSYLAAINLLLGIFNLVPAFPLDGGRVFRSIVWAVTHRFERATRVAATVGQAFGILMIALGVARILFGDFLGGLWTIFIGWFLTQAASAANQDRALRESLNGVRAGELMDASVPLVGPHMSLQQLVFEHLLRSERRRLIVVENGAPVGIVQARLVNSVPRDMWPTTPVERIMTPVPFSVSAQTPVVEILGQLSERSTLVPVVSDGSVVGAVDLMRILRFAQLRQELKVHVGPSSVRPSTA